MKLSILAGSTSQSVNVFIQDSASTTGAGKTGLVYTGITAYYTFAGANATATSITMATLATVTTAYASGGFIEISSANMPGLYRFDLPNAVLATSKGRSVVVYLTATGAAPTVLEIELTGWDNQDGTKGGLSNLDAAISSRMATFSLPTNFSSLAITVGGAVTAGTVSDKTGYALTQTFPTNFSSLAITAGGAVTVGTNNDKTGYTASTVSDKTGYSLSQAFPTNFSSMAISVGGAVTVGTNNDKTGYTASTVSDKTGYSLTQTFPTNFSAMSIDSSGNVATTSNIKKNTAKSGFMFVMTDSTTHAPKTGLTVAATRSLDGGAFSSCTNAVSEVATGTYVINLSAADTNGDHVMLRFTATGADDVNIEIVTQP